MYRNAKHRSRIFSDADSWDCRQQLSYAKGRVGSARLVAPLRPVCRVERQGRRSFVPRADDLEAPVPDQHWTRSLRHPDYRPISLLGKVGIQSRRREPARDNGTRLRKEAEIANGSPAGSRCHTSSIGCCAERRVCGSDFRRLPPPSCRRCIDSDWLLRYRAPVIRDRGDPNGSRSLAVPCGREACYFGFLLPAGRQ